MAKFRIKHYYFQNKILFEGHRSVKKCLEGALKAGVDLHDANLCGADLSGMDLSGVTLQGVHFVGANLEEVNFQGANLANSYFEGAKMYGANLENAYCGGAYFRGAWLASTNCKGTDFNGADLSGANFKPTNEAKIKGLPIERTQQLCFLRDQPGLCRAYILVTPEWKCCSNPNRGIVFNLGSWHESDNGIMLTMLNECLKYYEKGDRVLIAEFDPINISEIPLTSDGNFFVNKCQIVAEKDLSKILTSGG